MGAGKTALVTGASGQDGGHLTELLQGKGYRVLGTSRTSRSDPGSTCPNVEWLVWDGLDQGLLKTLFSQRRVDECYNLAAHASGAGMFDDPVGVGEINGLAVTRLLEAVRVHSPHTRFVQASSAEVFARSSESPQNEKTPRAPRSPYGAAKIYADDIVRIYRARYGLHASSAILYNHEGPRRSLGFVTRKVTRAAAAISLGKAEAVTLGDLDSRRDWGYAGDYVRAMWMMSQAPEADDYVIATGMSHSVRDLCACAFGRVGLDYREFVKHDPGLRRGSERIELVGSPEKIRRRLGWTPEIDFKAMIEMMVDNDIAELSA